MTSYTDLENTCKKNPKSIQDQKPLKSENQNTNTFTFVSYNCCELRIGRNI